MERGCYNCGERTSTVFSSACTGLQERGNGRSIGAEEGVCLRGADESFRAASCLPFAIAYRFQSPTLRYEAVGGGHGGWFELLFSLSLFLLSCFQATLFELRRGGEAVG
ncbi:hypothetical protein BCR35DRAFT_300852 [Leucosporidium creatinivorum]|uniref:Uncharacterized protein n=1 Tax=Leucosporidium creatinivorum TaxID=106004 RepID=A0A1Y2FYB8_9BASI|nr:hypothetical protein BCR35DRAFT_300852 [Leucosporidium creatinivorum]